MTDRGLYTEFAEYRDLDALEPANPTTGTIYAIDTNVLLNLYKFNKSTAREVLEALSRMSSTLFLPHHALFEFWSRREDVQRGVHHNEAVGKIESAMEDIGRVTGQWLTRTGLDARDAASELDSADINVDQELTNARTAIQRIANYIRATRTDSLAGEEWVIPMLETALRGQVGQAPGEAERKRWLDEFATRVKNNIPPGTRDAEIRKGDASKAFGDFFIWSQCLLEAKRRCADAKRPYDLTLITNDLKDDWVRSGRTENGDPLAHRHLIREYNDATGGQFRIRSFRALLDIANEHFGADVSEQSRAQVQARSQIDIGDWTLDAAIEYLDWLWANYQDQLKVLIASYAATQLDYEPLTTDAAKTLVSRESMAGFGTPYTSGLKQGVALRDLQIQEPMLRRMQTTDNGPFAYQLVGNPHKALALAIRSDEDFIAMYNDMKQALIRREEDRQDVEV
jgi:hypothetical protein